SHRYDYRAEWVKFIDALSAADASDLEERVIKAVSDIVDSPAGALWLRSGDLFRPAAVLNIRLSEHAKETAEATIVTAPAEAAVFRVFDAECSALAASWGEGAPALWLAIPLRHQGALMGFLVLAKARAPFRLDWEVSQLLGIVARQAASYLSEAQATRTLAD